MLRANEEKSSFPKNHTQWVHLARETLKSLVYNSWDDQSIQIDAAMKNKSCWLVLAKDYTSDTVSGVVIVLALYVILKFKFHIKFVY